MKKILLACALTASFIGLTGCSNFVPAQEQERLTVAKAQKEIKIGMYSSDVIEVLGAPNMVTTDDQRRETWVYDKISTNVQSKTSGAGVWLLIFGAATESSAYTSNQRTLTIIVKFDKNQKVRDFAYRTSSF